jgi:site-specific recombinase XerD
MAKRYNHQNIEPLFKEYLSAEKVSKITVKNYLSDIRAFLEWSEMHTRQHSVREEVSLSLHMNFGQVNSYLSYLQQSGKDIRSINRVLSSLRRFGQFCLKTGLLSDNPASRFQNIAHNNLQSDKTNDTSLMEVYRNYLSAELKLSPEDCKDRVYDVSEYCGYLNEQSVRISHPKDLSDLVNIQVYTDHLLYGHVKDELIERKKQSLVVFIEWLAIKGNISHDTKCKALENLRGRARVSGLKKNNHNDSKKPQIKNESAFKRNNMMLFSYISIGLVSVIICLVVIWIYFSNSSGSTQPSSFTASREEVGRSIHFQGRLYDKDGQPITTKQDVTFRLYKSKKSSDVLYEGSCTGVDGIVPNRNGEFFTEIGSDCSMGLIPEEVFFSNSLYIGLTVNSGEELRPRHALPTTSYARNSDQVKGLSVGNDNQSIPFINEEGNLVIGSESPTIESTAGQFTLEGNMLMMQTTPGSKGSIFLNPDVGGDTVIGSGKLGVGVTNPEVSLDVAGDIQTSGLLRFTNQKGLISTHTGGSLRLGDIDTSHVIIKPLEYVSLGTVETKDKITLGGNVVPSTDGLYNLGREDYTWGTVFAQEFIGADEGIQGYFKRTGSIVTTRFSHDSFALGSETNKNIFLSGKEGQSSWIRNGKFGIGTVSPEASLSVTAALDDAPISSFANLSTQDTSSTKVMSLRLGTDTGGSSARFMEFIAGATNEKEGTTIGSIRLNNNAVVYETSGADFAEYFRVDGETEVGDIVMTEENGITRATTKGSILGVVTNEAGFVGNAHQAEDGTLIGILGQIETHVSNLNGYIKKGDPVSTTEIEGYGARAVSEGQILGRALEDMSIDTTPHTVCPQNAQGYRDPQGDPLKCGRVRVMVSIQWYNPEISLTSAGDVYFEDQMHRRKNTEMTAEYETNDYFARIVSQLQQNANSLGAVSSQMLTAATVSTKHVVTQSLNAVDAQLIRLQADRIRSPVIETDRIETQDAVVETIEPKEKDITVDLVPDDNKSSQEALAEVMIKGMDDATVASIDARGNATFSGTITSDSTETQDLQATHITAEQMLSNLVRAEHATIAGTLRAGSIESETITEIEDNVNGLSDSLQQNQSTLSELDLENDSLTSVVEEIQRTIDEIDRVDSQVANKKYDELENLLISYSNEESGKQDILEKLKASSISVADLYVQGRAEMYDARISHGLTAGNVYIEGDAVLSLGYGLDISSLSTVTFFQDQVAISKEGDIVTQGSISAKHVSVVDQGGNEVAAIDSSGMASVHGIRVKRSKESTPSALLITPAENKQKHGIEAYAIDTHNTTAGEALVPVDSERIVVYNAHITDSSLVYLTSTSAVSSSYLRVSRKEACVERQPSCKPYFEVSKSDATSDEVSFNWLVIN